MSGRILELNGDMQMLKNILQNVKVLNRSSEIPVLEKSSNFNFDCCCSTKCRMLLNVSKVLLTHLVCPFGM
jgi:hypothetical protein